MLRSSAMRLQSDLPQSDMENLLRQRFPLRQRHRAGQGTTVSVSSPSVIKTGHDSRGSVSCPVDKAAQKRKATLKSPYLPLA